MATDPLAEDTTTKKETTPGFVQVTIKGGPYNRTEIVVNRPTWDEAAPELARMIQEVPQAQVSLDRSIATADSAGKAPAPGEHGRPAAANAQSTVELPFAEEVDPTKCAHGDRTLFEAKGKKGWVCPLAKGTEGRCETIFV